MGVNFLSRKKNERKSTKKKISFQMSMIRNTWYIYSIEYCSATKNNEIRLFVATYMDLEIVVLSEVSQKEKNKHHMTNSAVINIGVHVSLSIPVS